MVESSWLRDAKHPAGRPVNSQAGRPRYGAFGSSRWPDELEEQDFEIKTDFRS